MALGTVVLPFDIGAYGQPSKTILNGITDPNTAPSFGMVAGDQFNLVLYPRAQSGTLGNPTTTSQLPSGSSIIVTGKPALSPGSATVLFLSSSFSESNTNGTSGDWRYSGRLNLDTPELLAALPSNTSTIQVTLVIEINEGGGGVQRFLAPITINNPTYTGAEGAPAVATPGYLTAFESLAQFVQNLIDITGQTGGGNTNVDGISTTTGATPAAAGWKIELNDADSSRWRLDVGTGADVNVAGAKVIPVDYNAAIPLVWTRYS